MEMPKSYYLPQAKSIVAGVMLIFFGICLFCIGIDLKDSFRDNFRLAFLNFESIGGFIFSLFMLLFKVAFIAGGYLFLKYSDRIERARIDEHGFHYHEIPKGNGMKKVIMDAGPLNFTPYNTIKDISYRKNFWTGGQLTLTLDSGIVLLPALAPLKEQDKQEIAELVKTHLTPSA